MSRSAKWTKFCKNYFLGKGFCKTSANVFEIRRGSEFGFPCGGGVWGGIRAGFSFLFFGEWASRKNTRKMIKSFYEQSIRNVGSYR